MTDSSARTLPGAWSFPGRAQPEHRYLTSDQVDRLAEAMPDPQYSTMVYVLAYGGLRWGELAALRRDRVDVLRRQLQVTEALTELSGRLEFGSPKTHRSRTAYLPRFVAEMVGQHLETVPTEPESLVFTAPNGGPLRYSNMRRAHLEPGKIESRRGPGDHHPARPPPHLRVADESGGSRREGNPAATRSPQRNRDPRHIHPPLRGRPGRHHGQTRRLCSDQHAHFRSRDRRDQHPQRRRDRWLAPMSHLRSGAAPNVVGTEA